MAKLSSMAQPADTLETQTWDKNPHVTFIKTYIFTALTFDLQKKGGVWYYCMKKKNHVAYHHHSGE